MNPYTYIYGLKDPRDGLFHYIGKSNIPTIRFLQHLSKKDANIQKNLWLVDLEQSGQTPEMIVLEKVTIPEWQSKEREWIAKGIKSGWPLTNVQAGGGGNCRLETDWFSTMKIYFSESELENFRRLDKKMQATIGINVTLKMMPYTKSQLSSEGRVNEYIPGKEAEIGAKFATQLLDSLGTNLFYELIGTVSYS